MSAGLPPCPVGPHWIIDWKNLLRRYAWLRAMEGCPQDPIFHAEGDVLIHTRMVATELVKDLSWRALPEDERAVLFAAALLHDVAKPDCTIFEGERIRSPGHAKRGDRMTRVLLWEAGVAPKTREAVAALVRYHQMPYLLWDRPDPAALARRISMKARCDHLAILARADIRGRVCPDMGAQLENIALFMAQCEEIDCVEKPFPFASAHSRFLYFRRDARDPSYEAWDDTRCQVTMMCGLPGSGKNHWLSSFESGLPVVSLDAIRREMGIKPGSNKGGVTHLAKEKARGYLRARQDFAWNATNLNRDLRGSLVDLFADYHARVRIVCVDPPARTLLRQNRDREHAVPISVIRNMARRWEMPDLTEVHEIVWVTDFRGPSWERTLAP